MNILVFSRASAPLRAKSIQLRGMGPLVYILVLWLAIAAADVAFEKATATADLAAYTLTREETFRDYQARFFDAPDAGGAFELTKNGQRIFFKRGGRFYPGTLYEHTKSGRQTPLPMGRDITGNGVPDLVLSHWSGGGHCCLTVYVFEIGERFKQLGELKVRDADMSDFADKDGDGNLEFVTADAAFAYFSGAFAESYFPEVILRYDHGAYHFANDLMRKAPPHENDIADCARAVQRRGDDPPDLWPIALDLIYSGNAREAWQLIGMAWPRQSDVKSAVLDEFRARLEQTVYAADLRDINSSHAGARPYDWAKRCQRFASEGR